MNGVDGFDLLARDLDEIPEVEEWRVHDEGVILVTLKSGVRYRLVAEQIP